MYTIVYVYNCIYIYIYICIYIYIKYGFESIKWQGKHWFTAVFCSISPTISFHGLRMLFAFVNGRTHMHKCQLFVKIMVPEF